MNQENALWLLDVMTGEARRLMATVESQAKVIAELQAKLKSLETPPSISKEGSTP